MSSTAFSADLHPEPGLRGLVLASGLLLAALGVLLAVHVEVGTSARAVLALVWLCTVGRELWCLLRAFKRVGKLRLYPGGRVEIQRRDGGAQAARLAAGSIVLPGLAWLRVRTGDGLRFAELLQGNSRESEEWRRFQVIWRHIGAHC